jgi:hypothetical protein
VLKLTAGGPVFVIETSAETTVMMTCPLPVLTPLWLMLGTMALKEPPPPPEAEFPEGLAPPPPPL